MSLPSERGGSGLGNVALQQAEQGWLARGWHPQEARAVVSRRKDGEEQGPSWGRNCSVDGGRERKQAEKSLNKGKHKPKVVEAGGKENCN